MIKCFIYTVSMVAGAIGASAPAAGAEADRFAAGIERRVQEIQPTRSERKIDEIGWAQSIVEAERLAQRHQRPVFLLTHDGRISTGRC